MGKDLLDTALFIMLLVGTIVTLLFLMQCVVWVAPYFEKALTFIL